MFFKRKDNKNIKSTVRRKEYVKSSKKKIILIIAGLFIFIIILRLIVGGKKESYQNSDVKDRIPVEVVTATNGLIRDTIFLTARLEPQSEVKVFSPVPGWLDKLYVDIGSKVYKRQVVASIDRNIIGSEYSKAVVKSPISGSVGRIFVDIGSTVAQNVPIMSIVNYDNLKIYANIPEKYIYRVKKNDVVLIRVESLPGEEFIGKIEKVSSSIDALTGTFQAKIVIPNKKHKLKPGSFAEIRIVIDMKKGIIIPVESVVNFESEKPYVYKVVNGIARKVYIKKGIVEGDKVEVAEGLKAGDKVIITGVEVVQDGSKVFYTP